MQARGPKELPLQGRSALRQVQELRALPELVWRWREPQVRESLQPQESSPRVPLQSV